MAKLKDKIENGLNEVRILILGGQVLIGASFRTFFESGFNDLPHATQVALLYALGVMLAGFGPLLLPDAFHRIVEKGEATVRFRRLLNNALAFALLPFALGLAVDLFMSGEKIGGPTTAWISGIASGGLALGLWYGIEYIQRDRSRKSMAAKRSEEDEQQTRERGGESLTDKVKQVLMELRMVLPGTQALLGFQFVIILMPAFEKIPAHSKWIHLGSLIAIAVVIPLAAVLGRLEEALHAPLGLRAARRDQLDAQLLQGPAELRQPLGVAAALAPVLEDAVAVGVQGLGPAAAA